MENITELVEAIREAAETIRDRPGQPEAESNLTKAVEQAQMALDKLIIRCSETKAMDDLNLVIEATEHVLSVVPTDHPPRAMFLVSLSGLIANRFNQMKQAQDRKDIDDAIEICETAIQAASQNDEFRFFELYNSSRLHQTRYKSTTR